jgi:hypothetical protein
VSTRVQELANGFQEVVVHKDPELRTLVGDVKQHLLAPKSGAPVIDAVMKLIGIPGIKKYRLT